MSSKVPEVELQSLLSVVLPTVSTDVTLKNICDALSQEFIIDQQWWCFKTEPNHSKSHKTQVFSVVSKIFDRIMLLAQPSHSLVQLAIAEDTITLSQSTNRTRPAAFLHLSGPIFPTSSIKSWTDIVMPIEFTSASNNGSSNGSFAKVIRSMHHIMRSDPRRRFVFGLTLENTTARFWFCDRCGIVSSTVFDINKDWRSFVHIMLGITSAKQHQLGFDPDVKAVGQDATSPEYDITVHSPGQTESVYRTVEVLSDVGAGSMIGGGTRVWKVQKLANGVPSGDFYVLKDVWVRRDRLIEHEVLARIKSLYPEYARYFLTVVDAGFAAADPSDRLQLDDTTQTIRQGQSFVPTGHILRPQLAAEETTSYSESNSDQQAPTAAGSSGYASIFEQLGHWNHLEINRRPRRHYRIVFKEIGVPIHNLRSYQDLITAIRGGSEGLHAMHLAGYVHRDVSSGNILLVRGADSEDTRGVIMDLEYAQEVAGEFDPRDKNIGTFNFMSVEVAVSLYLHTPPEPIASLTLDDISGSMDYVPPFRQNQIHDLESVWWICMWMTFRLVGPDEHPTESYLTKYWRVFESHPARSSLWFHDPLFRRFTSHLPQREVIRAMSSWRTKLQKFYKKSYADGAYLCVAANSLEVARASRDKVLDRLLKVTADYPSDLKSLSELMPLPYTPMHVA